MKLNLVPVTVSRGAKTRGAWVFAIGFIILCGVGCVFMIITSQAALKEARDKVVAEREKANRAYATSKQAETDILLATESVRNTALAKSMISSNSLYPAFYQDLFRYIPPFFRVIQIRAVPTSAETVTVTMTGTLTSYQQYADLMLALLRDPNVARVGRLGYVKDDLYVPALQPLDQQGKPHRPTEGPIPDDPLQRLAYFQDQGAQRPNGYTGEGNFGSADSSARFAKPGDSRIDVNIEMKGKLQVPDPTATLLSVKGAAAGATATPGAGAPTGAGVMPGMAPGMAPGAPPSMAPGAPPAAPTGRGD